MSDDKFDLIYGRRRVDLPSFFFVETLKKHIKKKCVVVCLLHYFTFGHTSLIYTYILCCSSDIELTKKKKKKERENECTVCLNIELKTLSRNFWGHSSLLHSSDKGIIFITLLSCLHNKVCNLREIIADNE